MTAIIDELSVLQRIGNDKQLYLRLLEHFSMNNYIDDITLALKGGSGKEIFAAAHNLKGSAATLGFPLLFDCAAHICELTLNNVIFNTDSPEIKELNNAMDKTLYEIRSKLNSQ